MIASKIIFQSLTSVAVVGSVASGGYYMFNIGEDQYFLVSASNTDNALSNDLFTDNPTKTSSVPAVAGSLFLTSASADGGDSTGTDSTTVPSDSAASNPNAGTDTSTSSDSSPPETLTPAKPEEEKEDTKTQNYTCIRKTKKTEDKECKLFSIAFDDTNKSIDFSTIKSFIKAQVEAKETNTAKITKTLNKTDLTSKHFFILKSSTNFITPKMVEDKSQITLSSKDKGGADKDKNYATLTLVAQLKEDKAIAKTNLAIVKATILDADSSNLTIPTGQTKTYSCKLQNSENTELTNCVIQELENYVSTSFNFGKTTISTTQSDLTIAQEKHYLIKWTTPQKFSSLKHKIHFSVLPTQPSTQDESATAKKEPTFTELTFISPIIAHPTTTNLSEVIIIN